MAMSLFDDLFFWIQSFIGFGYFGCPGVPLSALSGTLFGFGGSNSIIPAAEFPLGSITVILVMVSTFFGVESRWAAKQAGFRKLLKASLTLQVLYHDPL